MLSNDATLKRLAIIFTVIGLAITLYLAYGTLTETTSICVEGGAINCETVQKSIYSKIAGIPITYLGLVAYVAILALLVSENRVNFLKEYGVTLLFGITLFAFLYCAYLVYLQFFVISALCPWCLTQELAMTLIFILSSLRLWRQMSQ